MDNLPKDNSGQNQTPSGEIFNDSTASPYQEATALPEELQDNQSPADQNADGMDIPAESGNMQPGNESVPPSPPYVVDNRKKFLVIGAAVIFFIILLMVIISIFGKRGSKSPENITLNYWGLWEDSQLMQPLFDEYKKNNPNITIKYTKQDQKQYRERLQAAIDRGEGPDIFRFHNSWVPMMINQLSSMPKTVYADDIYKSTFYPVATNDLKVAGNYYGIPLEIDGLLLFYNEDILKSANVAVPSTWVDVQNSIPKLTVKEKGRIVTSAIALGTAENIEHFSDILGLMMLQNGTKLTSSLSSCTDPASTTCSLDALSFYRKFAEAPNNTWDDSLENSIVAFSSGKVAMIIAPSWEAFTIKEISKNSTLNFKTAPVPQLPCDKTPCPSVNWASYWVEGVSNKSKYQAASWDFLKFLSQAESMQKLYAEQMKYRKLFGEPYSRVDLGKSLTDNPYISPLIMEAPTMKSFYLSSRTYDGESGINSSLIKYLKDAVNSLSQGTSVETALKTADSGFKQVFERFKITASNP